MIWKRPIEIFFLLAALGACKPRGNGVSEDLKSADWHERQRAVWVLGDSKDHAGAVRALEAVLRNDPVRDVGASAATALGRLGGPDVPALPLEKAASPDEPGARFAAVDAIETSRDPSAIPGLIN